MPIAKAYLRHPSILWNFIANLREALTPIEDQWTWTTVDGSLFEDVQVDDVEGNEVLFHHKFGEARLPIALLSDESRMKLEQGFQPAHHEVNLSHETEELAKQEKWNVLGGLLESNSNKFHPKLSTH
jgi:hypothetical protein